MTSRTRAFPNHRMPSRTCSHCTTTTGQSMRTDPRGRPGGVHPTKLGFDGLPRREPGPTIASMATSVRDHRLPFVQVLHRSLDLEAYFEAVDLALRRLVPFDASCWLSLDPATRLPTSHVSRLYGSTHLMALVANEYLEDDVNKFGDLAEAARPVGLPERGDRRRPAPQRAAFVQHPRAAGLRRRRASRGASGTAMPPGARSLSTVARTPSMDPRPTSSPTWGASSPPGSVGRSFERP